ncbi:NAD(P)-dependent dehydrogenase (short-subunit alcohol dehydrogenase family) [Saccharopolyspora erythraea NRRL 2338]|uniref:3-ketoacyl-(Acyl-carrier-protein) reductase n=2 Tax=Saccharopolyspora erythraea TaxID=1836 RepID=A4FDA2_SACEN|nr:SDR family oxidoreductase [Saccharopolyspora erythraea]PFG95770.1 NAD(P)-dependent dehydrogenase (short-subunit alcohol dehydrogenase family) [Saccharopolyspora erythraea NRRL 2338]QRK92360.1 SDR family oxidoreductase [Saccharopolyspora erythraea]CAM02027.1 3-ketoacyl-(acyl-carrier-protein) reductase [Saccharopolyspora erythraea NRRL 2338]
MTRGVLDGQVAVITGGSRGIGLAIGQAYRAAGAHVVLAARKADGLAEARSELLGVAAAGEVHTVVANAGEPEQAQRCVDEAMERFGRLDVLVNNAATNPYHGELIGLDPSRAEKTVRVNQYGMIAWTRCAWHAWMAEHGGAVVNIASVGGLIVDPHIGYYNATKAAMLHLTRQLAYELGPAARVNAIAPGLVKTELARAVWEVREPILTEKLPLRRLGTPEDVANAALFLASDASSWMTGQTLVLDGGALALPIGVEG